MNGLLLINKPKGITSFDIIRRLRRITGVKKIGHAGTLDPMATGLMLMLFGTACKQAGTLTKLDKEYLAEVTLGAVSSTGDAEGEITASSVVRHPPSVEIEAALERFTGLITQVPPVYSAIKIGGREAYKLAREGKTVEIPSRQVTVYEAEVTGYEWPRLNVRWQVSSGTYIRTLAQDVGQVLGTGAYLSGLIRTQVGEFTLDQALPLDSLEADAAAAALREIN